MIIEGHMTEPPPSDSLPLLWMTVGKLVSEKSNRMTWHSEWMPRREKFSKKFDLAFSSQNCSRDGVGSEGEEEEEAPKQRRFLDGMDLHLGAMMQLT